MNAAASVRETASKEKSLHRGHRVGWVEFLNSGSWLLAPEPFALASTECDFGSRTRRANLKHDEMEKLNLRDSELRALSDSESDYSV
jgi:hypothetical protein